MSSNPIYNSRFFFNPHTKNNWIIFIHSFNFLNFYSFYLSLKTGLIRMATDVIAKCSGHIAVFVKMNTSSFLKISPQLP